MIFHKFKVQFQKKRGVLSNNFPCLHSAGNSNLPNPQILHFKVTLRKKILKRAGSLFSWFKTSLAYFQYTYGVTFKEKFWNIARLHTGKSFLQRELKFIIWASGCPVPWKFGHIFVPSWLVIGVWLKIRDSSMCI